MSLVLGGLGGVNEISYIYFPKGHAPKGFRNEFTNILFASFQNHWQLSSLCLYNAYSEFYPDINKRDEQMALFWKNFLFVIGKTIEKTDTRNLCEIFGVLENGHTTKINSFMPYN